jgi:hypothetical protein
MQPNLKNGEKLVVTEDGVRVSGTVHSTTESAQAEAAARKKPLQEAPGATPAVKIVQQLHG